MPTFRQLLVILFFFVTAVSSSLAGGRRLLIKRNDAPVPVTECLKLPTTSAAPEMPTLLSRDTPANTALIQTLTPGEEDLVQASLASPRHAVPAKTYRTERQLTNAQRLARGMPPMMPRSLFNPSRTKRQSQPSGRTCTCPPDRTNAKGTFVSQSNGRVTCSYPSGNCQYNTLDGTVTSLGNLNCPLTGTSTCT